MTKDEQIVLSDAINAVNAKLDRAGHLTQALLDYFDKYDLDDVKEAFAIRYYFPRMRAFAALLHDQLEAIGQELPAVEWVDALKCEEGEA